MIATCYFCKRVLLPEDKELGYCSDEVSCKNHIKSTIAYTREARERRSQGYLS